MLRKKTFGTTNLKTHSLNQTKVEELLKNAYSRELQQLNENQQRYLKINLPPHIRAKSKVENAFYNSRNQQLIPLNDQFKENINTKQRLKEQTIFERLHVNGKSKKLKEVKRSFHQTLNWEHVKTKLMTEIEKIVQSKPDLTQRKVRLNPIYQVDNSLVINEFNNRKDLDETSSINPQSLYKQKQQRRKVTIVT